MQVVNSSQPFQTGQSGVGSVIFDYPKEQPLDILLKADNDLERFNQIRMAKTAAATKARQDMFANIKFDTEGALPQDIQAVIAPKTNEVYDYAAKVYSLPQDSPEFMQGMVELKRKQSEVERLINASVGFKNLFSKLQAPLDEDKTDVEATNLNAALLAGSPLQQRIGLLEQIGNPFVPNKTSFFDMAKKDYKDLPKSEEVVRNEKGDVVVEKLPSGEQLFSKSKGLTEADINNMGQIYFNSAPHISKATKEFNDLKNTDPIYQNSLNEEAKVRGVSPIRVYIEDNLRKLPREATKEKVDEGYAFRKAIDQQYKTKEDADNAKFVLEQLGNAMTGKVNVYNSKQTVPVQMDKIQALGVPIVNVGAGLRDVWYSNALRGTNAGVFSYEKQDANGNTIVDVKPNVIMGFKYVDGVPYIKTEESYINSGGSLAGERVDDEGYVKANDNIVAAIANANKIPYSMVRETLLKQGAYEGKTPQAGKMADEKVATVSNQKPVSKKTTAQKTKVVAGKTMPADATPKYSKTTGALIGYELPDGSKFKF